MQALLVLSLLGVAKDAGVAPPQKKPCVFGPAKAGPELGDKDLIELSGLVASRVHAGVLYAHNDSGDSPRFFAMDLAAQPLGRFELTGATARDWEDMALGPCPAGTCLFLGDIGDNRRVRDDYAVYRVKEPEVTVGKPAGTVQVPWEKLEYEFPGGEQINSETLLMRPVSGELYLATKEKPGVPSRVFKFPMPLNPAKKVTLLKVAELKVPAKTDQSLTAGDLSPDGTALLLRTYNRLVLLELTPGAPFETIFTADPKEVPVSAEPQGEAVGWRPDGRGYYTSSEAAKGVTPTLNVVECER